MSHLTPSEFAALECVAVERARIVAVLAPRQAPAPSISALLHGPATVRKVSPSLARHACNALACIAVAGLSGFYLPGLVVSLVSRVLA